MGNEYKMRQQIPDDLVKDAAEQFMSGWKLLEQNIIPGSGLLLPFINTGTLVIELYLKCLSSKVIHTPEGQIKDMYIVTAAPQKSGHNLCNIFKKIPESYKVEMQQAYASTYDDESRKFEDILRTLEGAFMDSRYSYETDRNIDKYSLKDLKNICEFLSKYVTNLKVKETIDC